MEKATVQVKRMSNMINGFLNVSRLESGKMLIQRRSFDLDDLIREAVKESELIVTTHIIHSNICDSVHVVADRDKIGSVITNLINNAVKYSPKGNNIYITCEITGNNGKVSVRDEGMGIKTTDIDKIFDRYYRVESNNSHQISGFGIGLYLSSEIIAGHNGEIGAESEFGQGSTFWFTLPLQK
jgi:signal transduction histidine kinase